MQNAYLKQAKHNLTVADFLLKGSPPKSRQWAITCNFYAAIHYVNAYIHDSGQLVPRDHGDRGLRVQRYMRPVYRAYQWLQARSEKARYDMQDPDQQQIDESRKRIQIIQNFVNKRINRVH